MFHFTAKSPSLGRIGKLSGTALCQWEESQSEIFPLFLARKVQVFNKYNVLKHS